MMFCPRMTGFDISEGQAWACALVGSVLPCVSLGGPAQAATSLSLPRPHSLPTPQVLLARTTDHPEGADANPKSKPPEESQRSGQGPKECPATV